MRRRSSLRRHSRGVMCKFNFDSIDAFSSLEFDLLGLVGVASATAAGRPARVSRATRPGEEWEAWSAAETRARVVSLSAIHSIFAS